MITGYQISRKAKITHQLRHYSVANSLADPFTSHPSHHHLSTIQSKSQLLKSYIVTPPIKPWPRRLFPQRLAKMISRMPNVDLSLQVFYHAGNYHPGFEHNYQTYQAIIHKLTRARAFEPIETLLSQLQKSGIKCQEKLLIDVIRSYGFTRRPKDALRVFLWMDDFGLRKSVRAFNLLLYVLILNEKYELVHALFKNSRRKFNIIPNVFTCNILLKAFWKKGDIDGALKVLDEMPAMLIVPNVVTYTTILGAYVSVGDMIGAKKMFNLILDRGWTPDVTAYTSLMNGFCKQGRFGDAVRVMDDMEDNRVYPTDVTYGIMIEAFCKEKKTGEALNLLDDMLKRKYMPSSVLCVRLIDALCEEGKVEDACILWKKLLKKNCTPDNAILSMLIHWLCKDGKILEARKLFNEFEKSSIPSVLTYNMLIAGMCEMGELFEAARLWDDMVEKGRVPNAFTYNMLIKGFCKGGIAKEGVRILMEMLDKKCLPNKSTYSVLLTALCESGDEAEVMKVLDMDKSGQMIDSDVWQILVAKFGSNVSKKRETVMGSKLVNSSC